MFNSSFSFKFSSLLISNVNKFCYNMSHNFSKHRIFTVYGSFYPYNRETMIFPLFMANRSMAGHAKWQNIKHIKEEKDRQKNLMCNKYARLVAIAVKGNKILIHFVMISLGILHL